MSKLTLLDETLRDGEQTAGVIFSSRQKMRIAYALSNLGVDTIVLMPAVSKSDQEFTRLLAKQEQDMYSDVGVACRLRKDEVDFALDVGVSKLSLFSPVSDILLKHMRGIDRETNLQQAFEITEYAKSHGMTVYFAGIDCPRADKDYLRHFVKNLAPTIDNFIVCDSVGLYKPSDVAAIVKDLKQIYSSIGMHMHNDFGLGVANTLIGIEAGADLISATFNGIGPRAGNAPFEEILMALKQLYDVELDLKYEQIGSLCKLIEKESGVKLQGHKPLVGDYVHLHEPGLHVKALLEEPSSFEPFPPEEIGMKRQVVFGGQSGRASIMYACGDIPEDIAISVLDRVKEATQILYLSDVQQIYREISGEEL